MYSTKTAGDKLGLKPDTVKKYCQKHPDIGVKLGHDWILTDKDIKKIQSLKRGRKMTENQRRIDKEVFGSKNIPGKLALILLYEQAIKEKRQDIIENMEAMYGLKRKTEST